MNQPWSPSLPYPTRPRTPGASLYAAQTTGNHGHTQDMYEPDPSVSTYDLADDERPGTHGTPWRAAPAKRVRTTLGRGKNPERQRPVVVVDANSRMLSALRPGILPAAQVRVMDEQQFMPARPAPRPPAMISLRPLIGREPLPYRLLFAGVAAAFSAAYLLALLHFWAPAHSGSEQHAHLAGGRLLAYANTLSFVPADPFTFVGNDWAATARVAVSDGGGAVQEYVPRNPIGLSLLYAACFRLALTPEQALLWAHLISPIAAAFAVLGTFFLARFAGGSFLGLLAAIAMAASQVLLQLASDPAGPAVSLALITWGFVFLVGWWRCGYVLLGLLAGLLLGCAFTVRYADGLLGVPLILACVLAWHWRRPFASGWRVLLPILTWTLPVAGLLAYNRRPFGAWTGYHLTGEISALDADNIVHNWEALLPWFTDTGLFFLLPLGVMGLLALCARRLPLGLVMLSWFALPVLGYCAYAWAGQGDSHLTVLLSVSPVVLFGATYLLRRVLYAPSDAAPQLVEAQDPYTGEAVYMLADPPTPLWRTLAAPVAAGLIVAAAIGVSAHLAVAADPEGGLPAEHQRRANLAAMGHFVAGNVKPGAVLFVDVPTKGGNVLNHLDVTGRYELYDADMFSSRFTRRVSAPWSPATEDGGRNPLQRQRYEYLSMLYEGMDDAEISAAAQRIIDRALAEERGVFLLMNDVEVRRFAQAHLLRGYQTQTVSTFHEWPLVAPARDAEPSSQRAWSLVRVTREQQLAGG